MQLDTPVGNVAAFQRFLGSPFLSEKPVFSCDPGKNVYFVISKLHVLESAFILSVLSSQRDLFLFTSVILSYSIFLKSNHFLAMLVCVTHSCSQGF